VRDKNFSRVFVSQSSNDTLRTPITLDSLRSTTELHSARIPNYITCN
jgi:hypothetical protein